jgi:alpha-glucosidase
MRLVLVLVMALAWACSGGGPAQDAGAGEVTEVAGGDTRDWVTPGPDWQRRTVFYQVWVRSFQDSNGDGIGDLPGLISRLDYLEALGIGALWLSPIHPTPYADSGYDVADYRAVNPDYGTLEDFQRLVEEAHARGIRVFADLVMNHTSDQHAWFQESRSSKDNPRADWYLWADQPNLPCTPGLQFGDSAWKWDEGRGQYYFHQFYEGQPDLNYRNPEVAAAMLDVARFWLGKGVDGFRVDAIYTLFEDLPGTPEDQFICGHHPLTHAYLKTLRQVLEEYPQRASLAEVWGPTGTTAAYFGDGQDEFHLALSMDQELAIQGALMLDAPSLLAPKLTDTLGRLPEGTQYATFLSSHDWPRVMHQTGNDPARARLAAVLLLTLPGTPIVYYGDEVGATNTTAQVVDKRDGSRAPMPWTAAPDLGFTTGTPWLAPAPGNETACVAAQDQDPDSLLALYRRLIALRNRLDFLGSAPIRVLRPATSTDKLLLFVREAQGRTLLVALSFAKQALPLTLDLSALVSVAATLELTSEAEVPALTPQNAAAYQVTLGPHGYAVWSL